MEVKWIYILVLLTFILTIQSVDSLDSKDSLVRKPRQTYYYYYSSSYYSGYDATWSYIGSMIGCCCCCCFPIIMVGVAVCLVACLTSNQDQGNQPSHIVTTTTTPPTTYPQAGYVYPQPVQTQEYPPATDMPKVPLGNYDPDAPPPSYATTQVQPPIGFQSY